MKNPLLLSAVLAIVLAPVVVQALPIPDAITAVADRLVSTQITSGGLAGTWTGEEPFTGSIVAGLVHAYELTGDSAYLDAAKLGGDYITTVHASNLYGDEAYALARLTQVGGGASYGATALAFYNNLDSYGYIRGFRGTDSSNAAFYVSEHAVAASMVGATDAAVWRDAVVSYLARIGDDAAFYPVQSLGVATWALNQIGPMDGTRVDPFGLIGEDMWEDVVLSDLVALLAAQQNPANDSFYHRFDNTAAGVGFEASGYLEDQAFGLLGMITSGNAALDANILAGRIAMANGIAADGIVYEHMVSGGADYAVYAGEFLQAIPEPATMIMLGIGGLLAARRRRK